MDRRSFLLRMLASLVGIAGGGFGTVEVVSTTDQTPAAAHTLFSDRSDAAQIGRYVLNRRAETKLCALNLDDAPGAGNPRSDSARKPDAIRQDIRTDYAEGRTVCVDGWILSVTEVRLCVSAALA